MDFQRQISCESIENIKKNTKTVVDEMLSRNSELLIVCGIGGSLLGAKAIIKAIKGEFQRSKVIFLGDNIQEQYLLNLFDKKIKNKKISVLYNSLSGNTRETVESYKFLQKQNIKFEYSVAVTKKSTQLPFNFDKVIRVNDDVSGRYSVFSEIGMIPILFDSINIDLFLQGVLDSFHQDILYDNFIKAQNYQKSYIQIFSTTDKRFNGIGKWYQQLIMESSGKDNKGLLILPVTYPADLHSVEQYLQDGYLNFTEILFSNNNKLTEVISIAHSNSLLHTYKIDNILYSLGFIMCELCEFNINLCSNYYKVNPFNQPGVEIYKDIMRRIEKD